MLFCGATGLVLSFMELPYEERALRKHKSNSENLHEMFEVLISAGHLNATARKVLGNACDLDLSPYFEPNWRFPGAFYFVVTIVTTIGYGNYVPKTPAGKTITCFIAVIGVACECDLRARGVRVRTAV